MGVSCMASALAAPEVFSARPHPGCSPGARCRCFLDPPGQKQLLGEVAAVGQQGLALNNPDLKHHLQHYRGGSTVSGLQAACILYLGVQLLLPGQDAGIDFGREYEMNKGMAKFQ